MSKFDFAKFREQVQNTNQELKKIFKGTDRRLEGIVKRELNGWHEANLKKARSPEWLEKVSKKNKETAKNLDWLEKTTSRNKELAKDPKWLENNQKGIEKRKQKGQLLKQQGKLEEFNKLFGVKEQHSKKTKKQMSASASERWAKTMKKVSIQGTVYDSIYKAAEALGVHKDTVVYRIKTKPDLYFYIE
jgi:hypothetical protein